MKTGAASGVSAASAATKAAFAIFIALLALGAGLTIWGSIRWNQERQEINASKGIGQTCEVVSLGPTYDSTCNTLFTCRNTFTITYSYTSGDKVFTQSQTVPNNPAYTSLEVGDNISCFGDGNLAFSTGGRLVVNPLWWYTAATQAIFGVGLSLLVGLLVFYLFGLFTNRK